MANSTDQALFRYVAHTFRMGTTSLHPLQRAGQVAADHTESFWGRGIHGKSLFDTPPARFTIERFPMVVPLQGSPRDPRFMVS